MLIVEYILEIITIWIGTEKNRPIIISIVSRIFFVSLYCNFNALSEHIAIQVDAQNYRVPLPRAVSGRFLAKYKICIRKL